jgi:ABC-type sugar transport system permease subunit
MKHAVVVMGVSVGTRVWDLERYAGGSEALSTDAMALEIYRTTISTAQANVAALLVIFLAIGVIALMRRRGDQP